MHSSFKLYIGATYNRDGKPQNVKRVSAILDTAAETAAHSFGGLTSYLTRGVYLNSSGQITTEPSIVFEIVTTSLDREKVRQFAEDLRSRLNSESILLTEQKLEEAVLVTGQHQVQ